MNPKTKTAKPMQLIILVEQKTILAGKHEKTNPDGPDEYLILQNLTDEDKDTFQKKLHALLAEYGFRTDHFGEKEAMIKRLTTPKPRSEYDKT